MEDRAEDRTENSINVEKPEKAERNTKQKELVKRVFGGMLTHPTAESVFEEVSKVSPGIGRATVYRILGAMVKSGEALRVPVYDGADRFDITTVPHSHAKCRICGRVSDVHDESGRLMSCSKEQEGTETPDGFKIENVTMLYYGVCRECREKAEE